MTNANANETERITVLNSNLLLLKINVTLTGTLTVPVKVPVKGPVIVPVKVTVKVTVTVSVPLKVTLTIPVTVTVTVTVMSRHAHPKVKKIKKQKCLQIYLHIGSNLIVS